MAVLLDASILIEAERGRLDIRPHVERRRDEESFLSVITASELLHGVHRASNDSQRAKRSAFVEALLERFPVLEIDLATARAHARIWSQLATQGTLIGPHDMWIAASCVAHGLTLVTANVREFARVRGLEIEEWSDG